MSQKVLKVIFRQALKRIDDDYIDQGRYREDMEAVHFLHQEHLNQELKQFLAGLGMGQETIRCMDAIGKVNVTEGKPGKGDGQDDYADTWVREKILEREQLLFAIFPEYLPEQSGQWSSRTLCPSTLAV